MKKICFICSKGGHFTQLKYLIKRLKKKNLFKKYKKIIITFKRKDIKSPPGTYFVTDTTTFIGVFRLLDPIKIILNSLQVLKIFLREKPDVIISNGAGVAVPACFIGKLLGLKIIYIESFSRIYKPSLSGRMIYPISDLFLVQWKEMKKHYPNAVYAGRLEQ